MTWYSFFIFIQLIIKFILHDKCLMKLHII